MERFPPEHETVKELFRLSGNNCEFPKCKKKLIDTTGYPVGYLISIESNEKEQPRYNPNLSNEKRITIDNLILLCPEHCVEFDLNEKKFTVEKLSKMKTKSEKSTKNRDFQVSDDVIAIIIQKYIDHYPSDKIPELDFTDREWIKEQQQYWAGPG